MQTWKNPEIYNIVNQLYFNKISFPDNPTESSLVAWWLGFQAFTSVAWVQSLVRGLRSHKPHGTTKKKKKKNL